MERREMWDGEERGDVGWRGERCEMEGKGWRGRDGGIERSDGGMEGERCGMERREMMWDGEGRDDAGWRGERWIKKRDE